MSERRTSRLRTREEYIDVVENRYFANVDRKDLESVLDCFHPDAVFTIQSAFSSQEGSDTGIKKLFENLFERYSEILHRDFRHVVDVEGKYCASQFSVENVSAHDGPETYLSNCNFFYFEGDWFRRVYVYWSIGPTEGFIHKLKPLQCQGYGRATFDLLRARALAV